MISQTLSRFLAGALLLATTLVNSSPIPIINERDTAERYIFANCVNNATSKGYAAIFWYYPDFLPDFPEPQETAYVNNKTTVKYEGKTTKVTSPFTLSAAIPSNATKAAEGDIVSTAASASSFAGPMAVIKGSGEIFYTPEANVNCYEAYWQRDNQPVEDP
ncbi:hypothetical protein BKA67DRAFT_530851 [Truncatella angustata]|uniref:Uncharacterized protein n=1 Tax=Truncatella angustata TaxID=152316 RepID=A0A9P8UZL6_9PEZI|nr:uncharacterized protein BKA67DRAFT_530851 [Truncatella angustata]KAH6660764.1 hypothetical protein BKA67DRAFT_530851 [Truncatella angustata]KAH8203009.1 hypothetical protein TruAng_002843 [Truncatella angustata]